VRQRKQWVSQTDKQSVDQTDGQWVRRTVDQWVSQTAGQSESGSDERSVSGSIRASFPFFQLTHQLANYQLALTGQLSLDAFPNEILTDSQLTER